MISREHINYSKSKPRMLKNEIREYKETLEFCFENKENWLEMPATIDLNSKLLEKEVEADLPIPDEEEESENRISRWATHVGMKENRPASPQKKFDDYVSWRPNPLKAPLGASQRLNISG